MAQTENVQKILKQNKEYIEIVTAEQERKLSDYIVESFVRFNELQSKIEEVISFVNELSQTASLQHKPDNSAVDNKKKNANVSQKSKT